MTSEPDLSKKIGDALFNLQLLEDAIRDYLDTTMKIIKKSVKTLPLNFSLYNKNHTLGTLVETFAKISANKKLVELLSEIPQKRNELAHKIWLDFRDELEKLGQLGKVQQIAHMQNYASVKIGEVLEIEEKAHFCLVMMIGEQVNLEGLLEKI